MDNGVEAAQSSSPLGGLSDSEFSSQDSADEDLCSETGFESKLQFRSIVFKARWKDAMSMAEIMNINKGNLLKSMGINRNGKIYLSIEETLGHPPSLSDLKELERQSNGLPLKIGHVDDGRVSLFSFDEVELPVLP